MYGIRKIDVMGGVLRESNTIAEHIREHMGNHGSVAGRCGEYGNRYGGEHY